MSKPGGPDTDSSQDRILYWLKSRGPQAASTLSARLGMTAVGARKHVMALVTQGLVDYEDRARSVGRPKRLFALTEAGHARFPDAHSALTVELLQSVRQVFGEAGLDKLIAERERSTLAQYRRALEPYRSLAGRVKALTRLRAREGYMAEWQRGRDGAYLLVENHCPVCAAAAACQGLCRSELEIFRDVLGDDVCVERIDHVLAGARRCVYRIEKRRATRPDNRTTSGTRGLRSGSK
ncbi:MAG: helix-turn-helix transcriptional regulator [Gammaproteobacteria bacterium]